MLIWVLAILRRLPVRYRLALVIGAILAPAAVTSVVLVRAVDAADKTLGSSIAKTVNDLMPVARLEVSLEQARFELERSALAQVAAPPLLLTLHIDADFTSLLGQHDLPTMLAKELSGAFSTWRKAAPMVEKVLKDQGPSSLSDAARTNSDRDLAQTITNLAQIHSQLLQSIESKYAQERRREHRYGTILLILWSAGLLAAAAAVALLAASILHPLREISRAALRLRHGDFNVRLSIVGRDEFTSVSKAMNAMAATIGEAHERLYDSTLRDSLTGVLNRRGLDQALEQRFHDAERLSILMVDVDHFKEINDSFGHRAGDEVLEGLAQCMVSVARGGDTIGRYGGDEFLVVLPGLASGGAEDLAQRIYLKLDQWNAGRPFPVQVSMGLAERRDGAMTPGQLIDAADAALYQAKEAGRGTFRTAAFKGVGRVQGA